jgi:hypothetical protein
MKPIKIITTILLAAWLFAACENDAFFFQDEARIRIVGDNKWTVDTDSLLFSFVTQPSDVTEFDIEATLYIMGKATSHNRTAALGIVAERTTAQSSQYSFPQQVIIPAGKSLATFMIRLRRSADLLENTVSLQIRVIDSDDFGVGAIEHSRLLLKWNDILSMPPNWNSFTQFFGTFSNVKYRFMLAQGIPELSTSTMGWSELMNWKILLQVAVDAYNAANPGNPLTDENGQPISF